MTRFPTFQPLTLDDADALYPRLWDYQPVTSELTFGNLYLWCEYYAFEWAVYEDYLLILAHHGEDEPFALMPIGPPPRVEITRVLLQWMRDARGLKNPAIQRADRRLADELESAEGMDVTPTRDDFDYVYRSADLGTLEGRRYSKKRNHINQFLHVYGLDYAYEPLTPELTSGCLALAELWCEQRMCEDDISLTHEFRGIRDVLEHFTELRMEGGVILVNDEVQAFALGERLNETTAVVHIEKANPNFRNIYPMMTKSFSEQRWLGQVDFINREQDLGIPGLRRAKESYYPDHLVEKFTVRQE